MIELEYGKSMYGGWYAQSINSDIELKASTLKELKQKATDINAKLIKRFDNLGNGIL